MGIRPECNGIAVCAGVGALELGLKLALGDAYRSVCYVEREGYAASVLVARMEDAAMDTAPVWDDLTTFDGKPWRGLVDLISAGFPCQPSSTAGRRKGTDDDRWLWPHIQRIVREVRPRLVFLENVSGLLNVNHGRAFASILGDLAELGYDAEWDMFSAKGVGAPHQRKRVFILAVRAGDDDVAQSVDGPESAVRQAGESGTSPEDPGPQSSGDSGELADAEGGNGSIPILKRESRQEGSQSGGRGKRMADAADLGCGRDRGREGSGGDGNLALPESPAPARHASEHAGEGGPLGPLGDGDDARLEGRRGSVDERTDELPAWPPGPSDIDSWAEVLRRWPQLEPAVRRVADEYSPRVDRLRALGNAVVPVVAAVAFLHLAERLGVTLELFPGNI